MTKLIFLLTLLPWGNSQANLTQGHELKFDSEPQTAYVIIAQQNFDGAVAMLEIMDLSGQVKYKLEESFTQVSLFVGNWPDGIYIVSLQRGDSKTVERLVID